MTNDKTFNNFFDLDYFAELVAEKLAEKLSNKAQAEKIAYSGKQMAQRVGLSYPQFRKNYREGLYKSSITQLGSKYFIDEAAFASIDKTRVRC